MEKFSIVWLRRDLRLHDQAALYHALRQSEVPVLLLFIFDRKILDQLQDRDDQRVNFIYQTILELKFALGRWDSDILVRYGNPVEVWKEVLHAYRIKAVYINRDYEPYAKVRDHEVQELLARNRIDFYSYKDQVIFESREVLKEDGNPYVVFTPFKKRWLQRLQELLDGVEDQEIPAFDTGPYLPKLAKITFKDFPSLPSMGFDPVILKVPDKKAKKSLIAQYDKTRDYPYLSGTSRLGVHLRFGTISIRALASAAIRLNATFLSELIWREFYSLILDRFPEVERTAFKPQYDKILWSNNEHHFKLWCEGQTGYPLVDAGMRELNKTGYMHNRVRMIAASFLCKHLLIDWRWGEAYFARRLLDYDLASNNGGWQWAAGCGTDAAPYFRIFSPEAQQKRFDPDFTYVLKWVPEMRTSRYPKPVVDHQAARKKCLQVYKNALEQT